MSKRPRPLPSRRPGFISKNGLLLRKQARRTGKGPLQQMAGEKKTPSNLLPDRESPEAPVQRVAAVEDRLFPDELHRAVKLAQQAQPGIVHGDMPGKGQGNPEELPGKGHAAPHVRIAVEVPENALPDPRSVNMESSIT